MEQTNVFHVKTNHFEGPLDLLLELIERRKLHINDISLAQVADGYLSYVEQHEEFPAKDAAHFLIVASTLVLLKSRSLLPGLTLSEEEETAISDLEERLKLLARIRTLAGGLPGNFSRKILFFREAEPQHHAVFSPSGVSKKRVADAMLEILKNLPNIRAVPQVVVRKIISMEDAMNDLTERITHTLSITFREFAKNGTGDKTKIVIGFLALLELVKRGIVSVRQNEHFEDIEIEGTDIGVPKYY